MEITLEQYENIQNYLDGVMTPQEEIVFLNELKQNASLKESFDFEKELRQNLRSIQDKKNLFEKPDDYYETDKNVADNNSIRNLIEQANNEWEQENKNSPNISELIIDNRPRLPKARVVNLKSWIGIAAAACVLLAVASLVLFLPQSHAPSSIVKNIDTSSIKKNTNITKTIPGDSIKNINPEAPGVDAIALFKKYYTKDTAHPSMPDLLAAVPEQYQKGNYSYTDEINFGNVPNTRGSSADINSKQNILQLGHYYKGISYIETNDNKKAVENLKWVIDSAQNPQLETKAQWYLALIYLKENNAKKALPLLSSLSKNSNEIQYHKKAAEVLKDLKEPEQQ